MRTGARVGLRAASSCVFLVLLGEIRRERDGDLALVDRSDEARLALVENLAGALHKAAAYVQPVGRLALGGCANLRTLPRVLVRAEPTKRDVANSRAAARLSPQGSTKITSGPRRSATRAEANRLYRRVFELGVGQGSKVRFGGACV